jgi:hypothetical protein
MSSKRKNESAVGIQRIMPPAKARQTNVANRMANTFGKAWQSVIRSTTE